MALTMNRPINLTQVITNARALPPVCYVAHVCTGTTVCITRGVPGFQPIDGDYTPEQMNGALAVQPTPQQVRAMHVGALFGWDQPGADPAHPVHAFDYTASAGEPL